MKNIKQHIKLANWLVIILLCFSPMIYHFITSEPIHSFEEYAKIMFRISLFYIFLLVVLDKICFMFNLYHMIDTNFVLDKVKYTSFKKLQKDFSNNYYVFNLATYATRELNYFHRPIILLPFSLLFKFKYQVESNLLIYSHKHHNTEKLYVRRSKMFTDFKNYDSDKILEFTNKNKLETYIYLIDDSEDLTLDKILETYELIFKYYERMYLDEMYLETADNRLERLITE